MEDYKTDSTDERLTAAQYAFRRGTVHTSVTGEDDILLDDGEADEAYEEDLAE